MTVGASTRFTPHTHPLVIFDWDGTLMDSVPRIVSALQTLARECKLPIPSVTAIHDIIGLSLPIALARLFNVSEVEQEQLIDVYREIYVEREQTPTPMFAGAEDVLSALQQAGYQLAVATGKARPGLERAWRQTNTGHYFSASRCAKEVLSKPDPQMLNEILQQVGVQGHQALMVGDSIHDMHMARNAGVVGIGVTYGVHSAQRLADAAPYAVIDDITALQDLLLAG